MTIFQKDNDAETTWEYKVTTVSVSLLTYLVAIVSIIAVDWEHVKHKCVGWWRRLVSLYSPSEGIAGPALDAQASSAETTADPKPEEAGNLAGSTSGAKDPENGAGKAVKRRFPWFPLPRNSSHQQAKGKEPDLDPPMTDGKLDV